MRRLTRRRCGSGFTLIECLLAISIFSILMTSAYAVFRAGIKAERSGEAMMEEMRQIRWILNDFSREVRNAIPPPDGTFEGEPVRLVILTLAPSEGGGDAVELRQVSYRIEQGDLTRRATLLKVTSSPFLQDADTLEILAPLRYLTFSFERIGETGERTWLSSWAGQPGMPSAIRIELKASDSPQHEGRADFDQIVPILADRGICLQSRES